MLQALIDLRSLLLDKGIDPDILPMLALRVSGVHEVYDYFEHDGRRPASDVDFNAAVVSTIAKAKATCGLRG